MSSNYTRGVLTSRGTYLDICLEEVWAELAACKISMAYLWMSYPNSYKENQLGGIIVPLRAENLLKVIRDSLEGDY